jgi:hypothetical protein
VLRLKIVDSREGREQNETTSNKHIPPSQDEQRQLRSNVGLQTQTLSTDKGGSGVNEKAEAAFSVTHLGPQNESVLGTKRKLTQDHGPHKRQCQNKNAVHQDKSGDRRLRSSSITQVEQSTKTPSTDSGFKEPDVPSNAAVNREKQPPPQLARLNLDQQGRNMKRLYSDIQQATDAVLASIGNIRNTPSPLQPEPSDSLKDLYARCWGSQWEEVRVRQTDDHVFTTPQVTASLLSAFLYEKVLAQRGCLQETITNLLEKAGSVGEALLEEFDVSHRGEPDPTLLRIIMTD